MQKRKFDELISYFNRKVSDMSIDQKYKMELLGMISAIGFAHEKELGTNLAEVGTDCISRQAAIEAIDTYIDKFDAIDANFLDGLKTANKLMMQLPPAQLARIADSGKNDCVSRQAEIDALRDYLVGKRCPDDGTLTCRLIENEVINKLPLIQPVIVRCKDCKHRDSEDKKCDCGHDILWQLPRRNDWFCADGER